MIVAYDHANEAHRRFVFSSFCLGSSMPDSVLRGLLQRGARLAILTSATNPEVYLGWAGVLDGAVVWSYTKLKLRCRGVMTALLDHLGVDTTVPIPTLFRTRAAEALSRRPGWSVTFKEVRTS